MTVLYINSFITEGTSKLVLLMEVSFVEGSFNMIKYQNGTRKVSLVVRCPIYTGEYPYNGLMGTDLPNLEVSIDLCNKLMEDMAQDSVYCIGQSL